MPDLPPVATTASPPEIRVADLLDRYDLFLLDAYGVLVDLDGALPGAAAFLAALEGRRKAWCLVSNTAARLPEHASRRYAGFGLDIPAERILTSGMLLPDYFSAHDLVGRRCLVLGPEDSRAYVARAGGLPRAPGETFDAVVLADQAGFPLLETLDWLLSALLPRLDRGETLPLVLPNPDLIYPKAGGYGLTAGGLAVMLEAILAQRYPHRPDLRFVRLGKPHPALLELALARLGPGRPVMLGDQPDTDIAAARALGVDAALVLGGVARQPADAGSGVPTWLLPSLSG